MIVAITCYFNPTKSKLRLENYQIFRKRIEAEGIELYCVELAFAKNDFQLNNSDADYMLQMTTTDVMWQKERLFNIILGILPSKFDKVIWIDCDIIYPDLGWSKRISDKLDKSALIQPYTWAIGLPKCQINNPSPCHLTIYNCFGSGVIRKSFCYYACHRNEYPNIHGGHVGYVWAATRELLDKHKFYDVIITGAGDLFMSMAAWGMFAVIDRTPHIENLSQVACNHWFDWGLPFYIDVSKSGGPSYTEDIIVHLWHGDISNRNYLAYSECLALCHFNPNEDLELDTNGCWKWKRKNYWLHDYVKDIFQKCNP